MIASAVLTLHLLEKARLERYNLKNLFPTVDSTRSPAGLAGEYLPSVI